jgi:glyoxylase-like metal-dependent hydrolase (beta-lactamase superfamily II)
VIEKALRHAGVSESALAERTGVELAKIRDAIDYRYDLSPEEIARLAQALALNQRGLLAVAGGRYPLPDIQGLPFCLYPLRTAHGIGVANAYVVADCSKQTGILFDTGTESEALRRVWPTNIRRLEAVFITHPEAEHVGGLGGLLRDFGRVPVFGPEAMRQEGVVAVGEGTRLQFAGFDVHVLSTPGHAEAHNCYLVRAPAAPTGSPLLVSGDLIFAGSVGGAYFCRQRLALHLQRMLETLPDDTVIAPGHGPLTTIKNERAFNPFVL